MNINSLRAMQQGGAGFDVIAAADGEQSNTKNWSAIKAIGDDADLKAELNPATFNCPIAFSKYTLGLFITFKI